MEITTEKRLRNNTVRPAISIPNDIWNEFKSVYNDKNIRDNIVSRLLQQQLNNEIVIVKIGIL